MTQRSTTVTGHWPAGCHDPDSCARHERCMYIRCEHERKSIKDVIRYQKHIWDCNRINDKGEVLPS